jgi:hypothetical protein
LYLAQKLYKLMLVLKANEKVAKMAKQSYRLKIFSQSDKS